MKTIEQLSDYLKEKQSEHDASTQGFSADAYAYAVAERKVHVIKDITPEKFVAAIEKEIQLEVRTIKRGISNKLDLFTVKQWTTSSLFILVYLELLEWMKAEEKEPAPHE